MPLEKMEPIICTGFLERHTLWPFFPCNCMAYFVPQVKGSLIELHSNKKSKINGTMEHANFRTSIRYYWRCEVWHHVNTCKTRRLHLQLPTKTVKPRIASQGNGPQFGIHTKCLLQQQQQQQQQHIFIIFTLYTFKLDYAGFLEGMQPLEQKSSLANSLTSKPDSKSLLLRQQKLLASHRLGAASNLWDFH